MQPAVQQRQTLSEASMSVGTLCGVPFAGRSFIEMSCRQYSGLEALNQLMKAQRYDLHFLCDVNMYFAIIMLTLVE